MAKTRTSRSGSLVTIDLSGLRGLATALRKAQPELVKTFRAALRQGGELVANDVRESTARWSTRIPQTVRTRTSGIRVSVIAGGARAPHAAAYEHRGEPGDVRHPVFGNRQVWTSKNTPARPSLRPSAERRAPEVADTVLDGVDEVLHQVGFE